MKKSIIVLFLLVSFIFTKAQNPSDELTKIKFLCRDLLLSPIPYATEQSYLLTDDVIYNLDGDGYFKSLSPDGSWPDINYKSQVGSAWSPSWHLYRLMLVARAYYRNQNPAYLTAVHKGLKFWITNDFICENWWQNQINTPYSYSSLLLMLNTDATQIEYDYLNKVLAKRVVQDKATGQNKIWQHDAEARIAMLNNDSKTFKNAIVQMQSVIKISTDEGIQPDYSFHQHGAMLQFGNYGIHFVNSLLFWIKVSSNTAYAFEQPLQKIIVDYCTEGLRYTIFKKGMDMNAIGRQLKINSALKRGQVLHDDLNLIKTLNMGDENQYSLDGFSAKSPNLTLNKNFWRSAYMLQSDQGKMLISVKLQGQFVRPVETVNFENLKGAFLNDGVTLVQRTGKEYQNIEPLWKWAMLPGITADTSVNPADENVFKAKNLAQFVGQVSNGKIGISAMDYNRLNVKAHKSYFLIDGMLIALGDGISADNQENLTTTVNQVFKNNQPLVKGKSKHGEQWLWHDGIAYVFPGKNQDVKTSIDKRKGSWSLIDKVSSDKPITDTIFTAYLSHQNNNSYSYLVKPNITLNETKKLADHMSIKIIQNTTDSQALQVGESYLMVFYKAGSIEFSSSLKITVDQPCMLIYDKKNIWIGDPTRNLKRVQLKINQKELNADFPQGELAGSTIQVKGIQTP